MHDYKNYQKDSSHQTNLAASRSKTNSTTSHSIGASDKEAALSSTLQIAIS